MTSKSEENISEISAVFLYIFLGYPINLSFSWKYNTLEIEAEIRLESEFVEINNLDGNDIANKPNIIRKVPLNGSEKHTTHRLHGDTSEGSPPISRVPMDPSGFHGTPMCPPPRPQGVPN